MRTFQKTLFVLALFVRPSLGQSPDPEALVRAAVANYNARQAQIKDYEYQERESRITTNSGGKKATHSDSYEIMSIQGKPYRRHIAHDDAPLPPEEEEQERQRLDAAMRKNADAAMQASLAKGAEVSAVIVFGKLRPRLSLDELPDLFDLRWKKEEVLGGRVTQVIDAKPKHGQRPSDDVKNDPRTCKLRLWIDEADKEIMRLEATVVHPAFLAHPDYVQLPHDAPIKGTALQVQQALIDSSMMYAPGTTLSWEWRKVNDEAWLPTQEQIKGSWVIAAKNMPRIQTGMMNGMPIEHEVVYSSYKKFGVTHRILPEVSR